MKKLIFVFLLLFGWTSMSFADSSGRAYIPHFYSYYDGTTTFTNFYISNKSNQSIDVKVALYGHQNNLGAPNLLADASTSSTSGIIRSPADLPNYSETTPGYSATFTLPAYQTTYIQLLPPSSPSGVLEFGYGKIEWSTPTEGISGALLAHGFARYVSGAYYQSSIIINGGNPF